jgi:hypothetical protein
MGAGVHPRRGDDAAQRGEVGGAPTGVASKRSWHGGGEGVPAQRRCR